MNIFYGLIIPFLGTSIGSLMVFIMRNDLNRKLEKILLGLASGVMIAASIWSLIIPSIEMSEKQEIISWLPATVGIILGILFLLLTDMFVFKLNQEKIEKITQKWSKNWMLLLAVTLHNIPEGMAVGIVFAGVLSGNTDISLASAYTLSIGIAIQNFPEGAIISMPLKNDGFSKKKAFYYGVLSGIVEPIAGFITLILTNIIYPLLPYLLAFAAGAMIYVVIDELIPKFQNKEFSSLGIIGFTIGFLIMMILDVALG